MVNVAIENINNIFIYFYFTIHKLFSIIGIIELQLNANVAFKMLKQDASLKKSQNK